MTRRHNDGGPDGQDIVNGQLKQLFEDDEFLTGLSRGVDPSEGNDPLAGLLLEMNREANADMPAVPDLSALLPGFGGTAQDADPGTTADSEAAVVALDSRRGFRGNRPKRASGHPGATTRKSHPFLHGLVGAAAATLVMAGGGAAIYNADADSPLYGLSTTLFGNTDSPSVVELASTLEEVDTRTANGDMEGARELLEEARAMLNTMDERQRSAREGVAPAPIPTTETATATVTRVETPEAPAPETVTETAIQTQTQTVVSTVVQAPVWTPEPTRVIEPPQPSVDPDPSDPDPSDPGTGGNTGGGEVVPPQIIGN